MKRKSSFCKISAVIFTLAVLSIITITDAQIQSGYAQTRDVFIPNLWDENERFPKPDLNRQPRLRFLTTTDFPPFNFIDRKKRLSGFHIDLAREICRQLELLNRCEIQALPWDELEKAIEEGDGEALLAGHAISSELREKFMFSRPYLRIPGRFVVRTDSELEAPAFQSLFRKTIGVVKGSSHAAYFDEVFASRTAKMFDTREAALQELSSGEIDAVFSDALSLSFWLSSAVSKDCCMFLDAAFESRKHFGAGLAVALPKGRQDLVDAMNYALSRINDEGRFAELYLRYFPVGIY